MRLTIWKYLIDVDKLDSEGETVIAMPMGAEILTAREQGRSVGVWARVDMDEIRIKKRKFAVAATGGRAPHTDYVGTAMFNQGTIVLHVFVVGDGTRSVPR